jgi:hypothetical protein
MVHSESLLTDRELVIRQINFGLKKSSLAALFYLVFCAIYVKEIFECLGWVGGSVIFD